MKVFFFYFCLIVGVLNVLTSPDVLYMALLSPIGILYLYFQFTNGKTKIEIGRPEHLG